MWDIFNRFRFAPKEQEKSGNGRGAPKTQSAQDFDELFETWNSMTGEKLTGSKLQRILREADEGYCSRQAALIDTIQEAEPIITSHLDTRKRAALAKPWRIEGGSEKDREEITRNLGSIGFQKLRGNSLDALAHGYNVSALLWAPGGAKLTGWKEVHATNVLFDTGGNAGLITGGGDKALSDWHQNQFMLHVHKTKPGLPCRGSLIRTLVWLYFFKFYAIRDYARYIERFGIPFTLAKLSNEDFADDAKTAKIITALRSMGTSGVGVVTKATDIEKQAVSAGGKAEFFNWFKYTDDTYALTILGQIASSKEANGMSNGDLQSGVKDDLTASDCEQEEETYNNAIIRPLDVFRNGRETGLKIIIDSAPPENMQAKALLVTTLAEGGYHAKHKWVEETFEIPLEPNVGLEVKKPETPKEPKAPEKEIKALSDALGSQRGEGANITKPTDRPDLSNKPDTTWIEQLTENTLRQLFTDNEAIAEFHAPITAAIRNSFKELDPDDPELEKKFIAAADGFFKQYPALYEEIDTNGIEKALSGAMLASKVNGYEGVAE